MSGQRDKLTADALAVIRFEWEMDAQVSEVQSAAEARWVRNGGRLLDHIAAVEAERDAAVEAMHAGLAACRDLRAALKRAAPGHPLGLDPDAPVRLGRAMGRYNALRNTATRAEEGSRGPHHHN